MVIAAYLSRKIEKKDLKKAYMHVTISYVRKIISMLNSLLAVTNTRNAHRNT